MWLILHFTTYKGYHAVQGTENKLSILWLLLCEHNLNILNNISRYILMLLLWSSVWCYD
jgi:hypothetical protein